MNILIWLRITTTTAQEKQNLSNITSISIIENMKRENFFLDVILEYI